MPVRDLVVGIDSSTTACKAVVWDARGQAVAAGRAALPMLKPQPAWHEQPVESWQRAAQKALRQALAQVDPSRLAGVCITTQRETFALANEHGTPLGPALLWMDERARGSLEEIDRVYGKQRSHQETGKPLSANLSLAKLVWLKNNRPEWFSTPPLVLDVHASLAHFLTGRFVTSWGCADPMGPFRHARERWHSGLLRALGWATPGAQASGRRARRIVARLPRAARHARRAAALRGLGEARRPGWACANQPGKPT